MGMSRERGGMGYGIGASIGRVAKTSTPKTPKTTGSGKPMTPAQYKKWYDQNQRAVRKATGGKFPKYKTKD